MKDNFAHNSLPALELQFLSALFTSFEVIMSVSSDAKLVLEIYEKSFNHDNEGI